MGNYETVIGLEVHVELRTQSKLFCSCANRFGAQPNTLCCPTCLGLPGSMPQLNRDAVGLALRAALALECTIAPVIRFDRKHYFYPDLPRGYQITQHAIPIGRGGSLEIHTDKGVKRIRIIQVHLEDDAGRMLRDADETSSLVDYNRSGVPLIEIVTAPDLASPQEARVFLETLKAVLQYLEVSDCKMQEGSLRCDANLSLRPNGASEYGTKIELKNINSFRNIERGLEYEQNRQVTVLEHDGRIVAETRRWDDDKGITVLMRTKETTSDYRYLLEPDIPALNIGQSWVNEVRAGLPELPNARCRRLMHVYNLPEYDANMISRSKVLADFFENVAAQGIEAKGVANWLLGELSRLLNDHQMEWEQIPINPVDLAALLNRVYDGSLSATTAKQILAQVFTQGIAIQNLINDQTRLQISDEQALRELVDGVIAAYPQIVAEVCLGRERALTYLVGQVMKLSKGRANPTMVHRLLREELRLS